MIRSLNILLIGFCYFFSSCSGDKKPPLRLAVSANMQFPIEEIVHNFQGKTGVECEIITGSTGKLATQIKEGAPFDVFIAADMEAPQNLYDLGVSNEPSEYGLGSLILWTCQKGIEPSIDLLLSDEIEHIAVGNEITAPYGRAGIEFLKNSGIYERVKSKLVFGESVTSVNQMIMSGSAEIGITSSSSQYIPEMAECGTGILLDTSLYAPIKQGVVTIKKDEPNPDAETFVSYLFTSSSRKILESYGYRF